MQWINYVSLALVLTTSAALAGGCGGDDDGGGSGGTCHCDWGDSCEEYASGCAFLECESGDGNAKFSGPCTQEDVVGVCTCASEDYVTYYTSEYIDPQEDCEFFCDDGVYEAR